MRTIVLVFLSLLLTGQVTAQEPMTLEEQELEEFKAEADEVFDEFATHLAKGVAIKKRQCIKAVGNPTFCDCIANNIPVRMFFTEYVILIIRTKDELKYETLSADEKKYVDLARAVRDECVTGKKK